MGQLDSTPVQPPATGSASLTHLSASAPLFCRSVAVTAGCLELCAPLVLLPAYPEPPALQRHQLHVKRKL
jgi:hypothetical protein